VKKSLTALIFDSGKSVLLRYLASHSRLLAFRSVRRGQQLHSRIKICHEGNALPVLPDQEFTFLLAPETTSYPILCPLTQVLNATAVTFLAPPLYARDACVNACSG
jgi:hypothetical protein